MDLREITPSQKDQYNQLVSHVIQSWEWGEFRKSLGLPLLRYGIYEQSSKSSISKKGKLSKAFQLTLHKIPFTNQYVGYLPKGPIPDKELSEALEIIGRKHHCAFIKIEPNIISTNKPYTIFPTFLPSPKPLFTKYNFILDLTKSEEELLKNMHPKTRYNIRLAQRKGVVVEEREDDKAFEIFLKLHFDTTQRQGFHSHNASYHRKLWQQLKSAGMARVLIGFYHKKPLSAWLLFNFQDTLYYPFGASSMEHKEVMANNLVAWEAIRLGKKLGLKEFDMWGAAHSPDPDSSDPFYGFHTFKKGYGGKLVEYIGTFDLVFNPTLYFAFTSIDKFTKLKVFLLRSKNLFRTKRELVH